MQLKALRLGTMALVGVAFLSMALSTPRAAAQTAEDPVIATEREAKTLFSRSTLDLVDMSARKVRLEYLSTLFKGRIPKRVAAQIALIEEFESGDPRALYETALRLRDGDGLPRHRGAALAWLERAGDHGVPEGLYAAARILLDEAVDDIDARMGESLLRRAARNGVAAAQKEFGLRQFFRGPRRDYDNRGYAWLLLAKANGADVSAAEFAATSEHLSEERRQDARARVRRAVGMARLPGIWPSSEDTDTREIFEEDLRTALRWQECGRALSIIDDARQAGLAAAEHESGLLYEEGTCVDQDAAKALDHFTAAVNGGHLRSAFRLSILYYDGRGASQDLAAARHWFKVAALSLVSFIGRGSETHAERLMSAERNMPRADRGIRRELPPELVAEIEWLSEIEDGDPQTLFETALRVRDGRGLPQARRAAEIWLSRAGSRGLPEASFELGLTLLGAPLRPSDEKGGIGYLAMAGRDGFVPGQVEMGRRYAAGHQVQQWDHAAYVWLLMAEENGADVAALLDEVGERLSDQERQTAREAAEKGTYYPLPSR